jgi:hypothetical protein
MNHSTAHLDAHPRWKHTNARAHARMRTTQPAIVVVRSPSVSSIAGLDDDVRVHESEGADVVSELRNDTDADARGNVAHARGDSACSTDGYVIDRRGLGSREAAVV